MAYILSSFSLEVSLVTILRFVGLCAFAAPLALPTVALAQDLDQAIMGTVASYENSRDNCYYSPEVEPIIGKMNDYLTNLYGDEWTAGLRQLEARLVPMVNAWRLGGVPECRFYGQAVARGLQVAPIMVGMSAEAEVARLTSGGERRLETAPTEHVEQPHNDMADFMDQYNAANSVGDLELLTVGDADTGYKIVANDIRRDGPIFSILLEAKGSRRDYRGVRIDCDAGTVRSFNEFNVHGDGVPDIKDKMEEAQAMALRVLCDTSGGD